MARLDWTAQAEIDLTEIALNVAHRSHSRETANRLLDPIHRACETLAENPGVGQLRPEFATGQLRS